MYFADCFSIERVDVERGKVVVKELEIKASDKYDFKAVYDFLCELLVSETTTVHRSYTHWKYVDGEMGLIDGTHYDIKDCYVRMFAYEDRVRFFVGRDSASVETFDVTADTTIHIDFEKGICSIDMCKYETYDDDDYYDIAFSIT